MRQSIPPIIAAILLLMPVLYLGSYVVLVVPEGVEHDTAKSFARIHGYYRFGGPIDLLYSPLGSVDRKLRPGVWVDPIPGLSQYCHRSGGKWVSNDSGLP